MTISEDVDVMVAGEELAVTEDAASRSLSWTAVILGALVAAALSSILLSFGATLGLGLSSTAPTWRDASAALWLASGLYLIIQALVSFGVGGYIAGRVSPAVVPLDPERDRAPRWPARAWRLGARRDPGCCARGADRQRSADAVQSYNDACGHQQQRRGAVVEL